jgi:hypothetical protein
MSAGDWKVLVERVLDDYRSTPDERRLAEDLARQFQDDPRSPSALQALATLQQTLQNIESRSHRLTNDSSSGRTGHATVAWMSLSSQLVAAEQKWGKVANVQFWLGILTVPLVLIAAGWLALGPIKIDPAGGVFLSLVVGAAVTHSFLVLRIHQQARQAEERIVEKRVGLAFLRVAVEDHAGNPEFEAMIRAGTQMFLGHHAAATIPLGPEDLRAALSAGVASKK